MARAHPSGLRIAIVWLTRLVALALLTSAAFAPRTATAQVTWDDDDDGGDTGSDAGSDDDVARVRARKTCPPGQAISPDTAGQCCWPGQAWNGTRCVGTPSTCPDGLTADPGQQACVSGTCQEHMVMTDDGRHCCWPGQAWSSTREACVGTPACPPGYGVDGESCRFEPPDTDGDTLDDVADGCPFRAEDVDGFEDDDGCPDLDNDGDSFADAGDRCPESAEDVDGFEDDDGCPDLDNDGDAVLDTDDQCPAVAEDIDGYDDGDGCPDVDNDGDGLADSEDRCPLQGEQLNGFEDDDGCPDAARLRSSTYEVAGWSTLAVGLALGGTSLALHMVAEDERASVTSPDAVDVHGANVDVTQREALTLEDRANALDTGAVVALGVGGAGIVAGAALLIMAYTEDTEQPAVTVSGQLDTQGASLEVGWRF